MAPFLKWLATERFLKREQDPRGIANWEQHPETNGGLRTYGVGLTKLRKYAKSLGRDARHRLQ